MKKFKIEDLFFEAHDIDDIGNHYWDDDYCADYSELLALASVFNDKLKEKYERLLKIKQ